MFLSSEISSVLDESSVFLFAIFLAVLIGSVNRNVHAIDALVLLQLSYGYFLSVYSLFGFRTRILRDRGAVRISTLGTYMRIFIAAAASGYCVWFWFVGLTELQQPLCETVLFFFSRLEVIKTGVRRLFKIVSIVGVAYYGTIAAIAVVTLVKLLIIRPLSGVPMDHARLRFWEKFQDNIMTKRKYVQHTKFPSFCSSFPRQCSSYN